MDVFGKTYTTNQLLILLESQKMKVLVSSLENTTLIVTLRTTNPVNSNVAAGQLNEVGNEYFDFKNENSLVACKN